MRFAFVFAFTFAACGGDDAPDEDPFDTYQMCFDEHHVTESFDVQKSITICCLDHPIGSSPKNVVCGETATTCMTYVNANLSPAPAASDVTAACADYITQRGM
jgi:hypothetical protein